MSIEELTNGKYWIAKASYSLEGCDCYYIIKSDKAPEYYYRFTAEIYQEISEDCFNEFSYIDYPDPESYEDTEDYEEDLEFWESNKESIDITCELITKELIESEYGEHWYLWDKPEPDYDLTK